MKITQALIDQAAMIANAKVGDELEEKHVRCEQWTDVLLGSVCLNDENFTYRIKPQPRVVYCNLYGDNVIGYDDDALARRYAERSSAVAIAVPFQQIGEGEKP